MSIASRSEQNRLICNGMKVEWHYLDCVLTAQQW
jgi:hypothetical protein